MTGGENMFSHAGRLAVGTSEKRTARYQLWLRHLCVDRSTFQLASSLGQVQFVSWLVSCCTVWDDSAQHVWLCSVKPLLNKFAWNCRLWESTKTFLMHSAYMKHTHTQDDGANGDLGGRKKSTLDTNRWQMWLEFSGFTLQNSSQMIALDFCQPLTDWMVYIFKATASYDQGANNRTVAFCQGKSKGLAADAVISDLLKGHRCGWTHPAQTPHWMFPVSVDTVEF